MKGKLTYKSDAQIKRHIAASGPESQHSMAHERRESPGFERAEHRIGGKAYGKMTKSERSAAMSKKR